MYFQDVFFRKVKIFTTKHEQAFTYRYIFRNERAQDLPTFWYVYCQYDYIRNEPNKSINPRLMSTRPDTDTIPWDALAQSIADGEAVLILGPDAIPFYPSGEAEAGAMPEEMTFSQLSRRVIRDTPEIGVNFFYERDNLFLFRDEMSKKLARKAVRDLARDERWMPDEELLRQIVQMPFHLVLSLSPDRVVYDAFVRHFHEPQFDFCSPYRKDAGKPLQEPDRFNPLVYNLCGNVLEKLDSPVLDYFDLFQLFIKLLGNSDEIPVWLGRKLREADTYILLGIQLDRWYFQMFLHYLNWLDSNAFTNVNQNFPILSQVDDGMREFVLSQFNIRQIAPGRGDFDALYNACAEKGILRELHDPLSPAQTQIRVLLTQLKYEEAFDLLEHQLDHLERAVDLPHLKARYQHWKQHRKENTADSRELDVEINKIRYTLLTYASQLKNA